MTRRVGQLAIAALGAAACSSDPPSSSRGASGALDDDLACFIFPDDGFASVYLGDHHWMEVYLPPSGPDLWGRGTAYYGYQDDDQCRYDLPGIAVRVQYGRAQVDPPGWDLGSTHYRALFVEGLEFPPGEACSDDDPGCDPARCRTVEGARAEALAMWCASVEGAAP